MELERLRGEDRLGPGDASKLAMRVGQRLVVRRSCELGRRGGKGWVRSLAKCSLLLLCSCPAMKEVGAGEAKGRIKAVGSDQRLVVVGYVDVDQYVAEVLDADLDVGFDTASYVASCVAIQVVGMVIDVKEGEVEDSIDTFQAGNDLDMVV